MKEFYLHKEKEAGRKKALIFASRKILAVIWSILMMDIPSASERGTVAVSRLRADVGG